MRGQSVETKGSGSKPNILKNFGGAYSCTCPDWRNQSLGIERHTCNHLRKLCANAAEEVRIGSTMPAMTQAKEQGDLRAPRSC